MSSLLDGGAHYEVCTVYPEEQVTDADGNKKTRPSAAGFTAYARFDIQGQSGTSSRRQEQDNEGFESEKVYSVRFPRAFDAEHGEIGAQSQIGWRGVRWALFGDVQRYNRTPATAHNVYTIKRY
jgi:hypothetical protein